MKTTLILSREYKKSVIDFVIALLAAQVNRKIDSDIELHGRRDQVTAACLLAKQWSICAK